MICKFENPVFPVPTLAASMDEFFSDSVYEEWVEKKTEELLDKYGYVFRERL